MMTVFVRFVFLISLVLCSHAYGQRMARVLYYDAPKEAPATAFVYQKGKGPVEVKLERHNFSLSFDLRSGDNRLTFLPDLLADNDPLPKGAPFVDIPQSWKKVLILAFADPSNTVMPIQFEAINASDNVFAPGELLFINFSTLTVFGTVGEQKLTLGPNNMEVVAHPRKGDGGYRLTLDSVQKTKDSRRFLVRQTWRHNEDLRQVVFILRLPPPRMAKLYCAPVRNF